MSLPPTSEEPAGSSSVLPAMRSSRMRYLWLVGVAFYVGIVWYLGWRRIGSELASVDKRALAAMAFGLVGALWIRAAKWRIVLGPQQSAARLFFISKAGGAISPGRVGELAPLLFRQHRSAHLGAWIVADRLLEGGSTIGLGLAGLLLSQVPKEYMGITFGVAFLALAIVPFGVLTRRHAFARLAQRAREGSRMHKALTILENLSSEMIALGRVLPLACAITVFCTCLDIGVARMLYGSLGYWVPFALLAVVQCAHGLASITPITPNATGVPYLVAASLLYTVGGVPETSLAAAVGITVTVTGIVFWTSFCVGVFATGGRTAD